MVGPFKILFILIQRPDFVVQGGPKLTVAPLLPLIAGIIGCVPMLSLYFVLSRDNWSISCKYLKIVVMIVLDGFVSQAKVI